MREIGSLTVEIHIPQANSLKQKRQVVRSLKDRLRSKFNVSVAEVDHLDKWQRCTLEIVMVGNDHRYLDSALARIGQFIEVEISFSALIIRRQLSFF